MSTIIQLKNLFEEHRNPDQAKAMEQYMRNLFPFLGIKSPLRTELQRQFFTNTALIKQPFNEDFVRELWNLEEREYQYVALVYIEKSLKKLRKEHLALMEELITKKSWWDTVDSLAPKPVGTIASEVPEVIPETINSWAENDDMWLRRTAILFQLKYKDRTNEDLLFTYIRKSKDSKEFFIQKAIGWALREYSKTNPGSVGAFIDQTDLSPLSRREGGKYLI